MGEEIDSPEWLWFIFYLFFFFIIYLFFRKVENHEKFAILREKNKTRDFRYAILIFAIFIDRNDPLRESGILFSKIFFLFQLSFIFIPAIVIFSIEKIFLVIL